MEKRTNFYGNELNIERVEMAINYLAENLSLKEILKVIREISYDMVSYYDKENCSIIYKNKEYSPLNREQACRIQAALTTMCDLFGQSIINKREFEEDYLSQWLDGGYLRNKVNDLEEQIKRMKGINHEED